MTLPDEALDEDEELNITAGDLDDVFRGVVDSAGDYPDTVFATGVCVGAERMHKALMERHDD